MYPSRFRYEAPRSLDGDGLPAPEPGLVEPLDHLGQRAVRPGRL